MKNENTKQVEDLDELKNSLSKLDKRLAAISRGMESTMIADYVLLLNKPINLIWRNLLAGTARGVGIAIGFTVFAATILYLLRMLGALNLPIIGDFIADLVRIVQVQLDVT